VQLTNRVVVTVTFLRMERPPNDPPRPLPLDVSIVRVPAPSVAFYRYLYQTVGGPHLWWLRRTMPDETLATLLSDPAVSLDVLYRGGEAVGFYELDGRLRPDMNLSYFGLVPWAVGCGLGSRFLRVAVDQAWSSSPRAVTVNTCTADHPRALPTYLRVGFRPLRSVREIWDVPARLGMTVPDHLRI